MARRPRSTLVAGFDVDSDAARLVTLHDPGDGSVEVTDTRHAALDPSWFDSGTPTDTKAITQVLRALVKDAGVRGKTKVHAATANEPVILRLITPPPVPADQLDGVLAYEIRKNLPIGEDEAEIDYELIDEGGEHRALIGAVRREHAQAMATLLASARVSLASLEPRPLAIMRATRPPTGDPDIVMLLNAESATITARTPRVLIANRVSDIGTRHLDSDPDNAARALIADVSEVARTLTSSLGSEFTLTLAGTDPSDSGLGAMMRAHFDRDVRPCTFADAIADAAPAAGIDGHSPFLTAIGLAMKGLAP